MNPNFILIWVLCALLFALELSQCKTSGPFPVPSSVLPSRAPSASAAAPPQPHSYILPAGQEVMRAGLRGSMHVLFRDQHHKPNFQGKAGCMSWDRGYWYLAQAEGSPASQSQLGMVSLAGKHAVEMLYLSIFCTQVGWLRTGLVTAVGYCILPHGDSSLQW